MDFFSTEYIILFSALTAFIITYAAIPSIVRVAKLKSLTDKPNERKMHSSEVPTLGGIAIFAGVMISALMFTDVSNFPQLAYIAVGAILLFFIGIKDDILVIAPTTKLFGQILTGIILAVFTDIRLTDLHGFFNIHHIPEYVSIALSVFVIVVIVNSLNLVDGIDGLASGIGIVAGSSYGIWFYQTGHIPEAIISVSLVGALLAFLRFNLFSKKEKIFMGDTGSLILGYFLAVLTIRFNEYNIDHDFKYAIWGAPAVSVAILVIPLFDTIRVMFIRVIIRQPIFLPDKRHIHHLFMRAGLSQTQTLIVILFINIVYAFVLFTFHNIVGIRTWFLILILSSMVIFYIPVAILRIKRYKKKKKNDG
ncbi:MAG: MraY family glycosyltransferase [Bacteroidota bacterium]|nr:MraY family glycosyltransferase [Bacteroidota bacterium]